jgi:hypothetical protein
MPYAAKDVYAFERTVVTAQEYLDCNTGIPMPDGRIDSSALSVVLINYVVGLNISKS